MEDFLPVPQSNVVIPAYVPGKPSVSFQSQSDTATPAVTPKQTMAPPVVPPQLPGVVPPPAPKRSDSAGLLSEPDGSAPCPFRFRLLLLQTLQAKVVDFRCVLAMWVRLKIVRPLRLQACGAT